MRRPNFWQVYHDNTARLLIEPVSPKQYGYFTVQNEMLDILAIALSHQLKLIFALY